MVRPKKLLPFPCPKCGEKYGGPINYTAYKTKNSGVIVYVRIKHDNKWCSMKLNNYYAEKTFVTDNIPILKVFDLPGNADRRMLNFKISEVILKEWKKGIDAYEKKILQEDLHRAPTVNCPIHHR